MSLILTLLCQTTIGGSTDGILCTSYRCIYEVCILATSQVSVPKYRTTCHRRRWTTAKNVFAVSISKSDCYDDDDDYDI